MATVASADTYVKRLVIILSAILVSLLAIVSIYSVLPDDNQVPESEEVEEAASPERSYPGQIFEIDDIEYPLSIGCYSGLEGENVFLVYIENRGLTATSYVVAAELSDAEGQSVEAVADVPDLQPGEQREAVLLPRQDLDRINGCSITAVQGDRRILLGR